jgi:Fe-S-cluster containining protein
MKKKNGHHRAAPHRVKRTDPTVPPAARIIEDEIVSILTRLVKRPYPSCLDKEFRSGYSSVLDLFSVYQENVLAAYPLAANCTKGCGICCNHWPEDTYSFEVRLIADHLRTHRPYEIDGIVELLKADIRCLQNIKRTVEGGFKDRAGRDPCAGIDPYDVVLSSFYQFNRPCPLLDKNGSCTIYAIRPFTCRVYISFSSPDLCRPESILGEKAMTYLLDLEKDASELFDRLHFMYDVFDGDTSLRSMLYRALTK